MATGAKAAIVTGAASGSGGPWRSAWSTAASMSWPSTRTRRPSRRWPPRWPAARLRPDPPRRPHPAGGLRPDRGGRAERFGRIDILVNNAGIGQASVRADQRKNPIRFWEATPEQWNRFLAVNATAPIMMARAVVPHMLRARQGRIITVTTSLGTMVRAGYLLYGSSKATAESATAVMAADLARPASPPMSWCRAG